MLLFVKALCYSLHLTSSASISVFWMLLLGLQLQLEQPQLVTSSRSFSVAVLVHCNCLPFLFFQLSPFVPRHSHINKVTLYFSFVQHNSVRPSVLKDMICLDIKMLQIFDPAFSAALAGLWLYLLTLPTKPNFWHSSWCTILAILSCLCLYSLWASYLHSIIKRVIDSSLSPHIQRFSITSWPSMFFLVQFILRAGFCAANIKTSVSFFKRLLFLSDGFTMELFLFLLLVSFFLFLFLKCRFSSFIMWQNALISRKSQ